MFQILRRLRQLAPVQPAVNDRAEHARRIAAASSELARQRPPLEANVVRAGQNVDRAREAVRAMERALAATHRALRDATVPQEGVIAQSMAALVASAHPALARTVREIQVLIAGDYPMVFTMERHRRSGRSVMVATNLQEIDAERDRLRRLVDQVEALTLSVDADVLERLATLRADAGLPVLGTADA